MHPRVLKEAAVSADRNLEDRRRTPATLVLLVVILLIGVVASFTRPAPAQPAVAAAPNAAADHAGSAARFGVAAGGIIQWASDRDLARELDGIVALGAGWIRFDLKWVVIEPRKGVYNWKVHDRIVRMARKRGLNILATLAYSPRWARPAGTDEKGAPLDVADYARFAAAAVKRYAPVGVTHYEIWNEPNIVDFWKPQPDPAKYTAMLKAAYFAIKRFAPSVTVLAGAFSPAGGYHDPLCQEGTSTAPDSINGIDFLEAMYAAGAGGSFDALAFHPYTSPGSPYDTHRCNAWNQMVGTSPSLRSVMEANGDGAKQIWATEYGSPATIGEAQQAELLRQAFQLWPTYDWAGPLFYYAYRDSLEHYNLVRPDWSPRPAWFAYREVTAASTGSLAVAAARRASNGSQG